MPGSHAPRSARVGIFVRFLSLVEFLGNLLPHPVTLFALFALGIVLLSGVFGALGVAVDDPRPEGGTIAAISLVNGDGLRRIVSNLVTNFVNFKPLGTVLVALLGVGVAEASGLLGAFVRALVLRAPARLLTATVVFCGVLSNTASEMGYVVLIPLSAAIFKAVGRHPIVGLAAAFAAVSGGYSANLVIGTVDPLLSGITQEAARLIAPEYEANPAINLYFMMISTVMITVLGTWVTERIVEPRLGAWDPSHADPDADLDAGGAANLEPLSADERRGLRNAGLSVLALGLLLAWAVVPADGVLRDPATGAIKSSPFLKGIVAFIFVFFFVPGVVYGRAVGTMRREQQIVDGMARAISSLGLYVVLVFFAAQFVAYFGWTNLGPIMAVTGANFLKAIDFTGPEVFVPFILMCCFVNLMLGSASAQWAVTAPIFVPMLMTVGYSPEVIQAAYRIGDSTTNIITPMMSYFGLILAFANRYDRKLGIGTLISAMLPYSIVFLMGWMVLFYLWVFGLGLPVGPGSPTYWP